MKRGFHAADWEEVIAMVLIATFCIVALSFGFVTARSNGKITERLATACIESGGTWVPNDGGWHEDAGCQR